MSTAVRTSLVLGKVWFTRSVDHIGIGAARGLVFLMVPGDALRIRITSRVVQKNYIQNGKRYAIAYVTDGYAETITMLVSNPSINKFQELQRRQQAGTLPTREVWKKVKPKKRPG